ncbi:S8 family peptidase [Ostreiculturibacter nitratireducens]|uniref:S8 family peptidase n=1 Tax=Ostreiculturibacter nitratireducens TaxID=3075226 RepID=UPI0031B616D8
MSRLLLRPILLLSLLFLAACQGGGGEDDGGGGGGDPGGSGVLGSYYVPSFDPFEAIAANLRDNVAKYTIQHNEWFFPTDPGTVYESYPLAAARVEYAHAVGLTGEGQIISVVDAGFLQNHEVFAGKLKYSTGSPPVDDHGTMVASVAAGNSSTMIGVAPGADLAFGSFATSATLAAATNQARTLGAVAQNNSWGYVLPVNMTSFNAVFSGADGASYLAALDAYIAASGVVLFAISNDSSATTAGIMDALPLLRPSLESGWLAVGNAVADFDSDGINSAQRISAPCLEAARWCLFADGTWWGAASSSTSAYQFGTGSSFATPQVAGALALLAEAFPDLTPQQLRIRLLASADNSFFAPDGSVELVPGFSHDYSNEFGHGFLDLRAALLPIGTTTLEMADGTRFEADRPVIVTGSAMGDAVTRSLAAINVAVTDSLSAGFRMPGEALAAPTAPQPLSAGLAERRIAANLTSLRTAPAALSRSSFDAYPGRTLDLSDSESGIDVSLLLPSGGAGSDDYGLSIQKALTDGPTRLEVGLKLARDGGSVIGFGESQAGGDGADLVAVELGLHSDFANGGFLSITGEAGLANLQGSSVLSGSSQASFNSFGVDVGQRGVFAKGDRLALGVSRPIAITSGRSSISLPVVRADGGIETRAVAIDLAPQERQLDLSLTYQVPLGKRQELLLEVLHAENFGNQQGVTDTAAVVGLKFTF